jgi:hypothetical protein
MKPICTINLSKPWNRYPHSERSIHFEELKNEVVSILNKSLPKLKKVLNKDSFNLLLKLINTLAESKNPDDFENKWFPIHMFTGKENILLKFK